jgi:hypothetical protein
LLATSHLRDVPNNNKKKASNALWKKPILLCFL